MRGKFLLAFLLTAVLAISAWKVFADEDKQGPGDNGQAAMNDSGDRPEGMQGGMMGGHLEKMKEKLGLSDSQASKLKDFFKKQMEDMKPLRDQVKIDMDTLQQKVDTKASDGDVKKVLDALSADRKGMEAGRKKMEDQLKEILSPTQQAKFVLGMKERGREMMGKWMGKRRDGGKDGKRDGTDKGAMDPDNNDGSGKGGAKDN